MSQRVLVIGSGGIGSLYAALLHKAGWQSGYGGAHRPRRLAPARAKNRQRAGRFVLQTRSCLCQRRRSRPRRLDFTRG